MAKQPGKKRPRKPKAAGARLIPAPDIAEFPQIPPSIVETMGQDELDRALATGQHREALESYFGPELYRELSTLAGEVQRKGLRGGTPVAILPGIMGSELSIGKSDTPLLIWLNLLLTVFGRTRTLKLDSTGDKSARATGVLVRFYSKLRLRLQAKGYDARFIHFDWRLSLDQLGAALLKQISDSEKGRIHLVCHSMGGLVARAAALKGRAHFDRVIQLGTPNYGSFSPVTALRGVSPTARKIERIDLTQDMDDYIRLFASFPGLLQMIPSPERYTQSDLFDLKNWPKGMSAYVTAAALNAARKVQDTALADGDERFSLIAGIDQRTIVASQLDAAGKEFTFFETDEGDGTVPLALARLDNVKTYFVAEEHGALPNNNRVADAIDEIIRTGKTVVFPDTRATRGTVAAREITEQELAARAELETPLSRAPTAQEERHLLDEFLSVSSKDREAGAISVGSPAPEGQAHSHAHRSRSVVVGRKRQRCVEINLALGSVTEVNARAIVLGIFEQVTPSGAAAAVDMALGGTVSRYIERRMFKGALGEVTVIPVSRRQLRTEFVVFSGLGSFDQFSPSMLQTIGANLARMLVDTEIEDAAIVPFGGGAGFSGAIVLRNFLGGFLSGLADADDRQNFRRLTICEIDQTRYEGMVAEVLELTTTDLFDAFEATVDQITLPPPPAAVARGAIRGGPTPVYLIARRYSSDPGIPQDRGDIFECSLLGTGAAAAILTDRRTINPDVLDVDFRQLDEGKFTNADLKKLGTRIADEFVGPKISEGLEKAYAAHPDSPLIIVHDAGASRIPWEALRIREWRPALQSGLSRRYMSSDLSVAKWLSGRFVDDRLDILLVVDPTEDLLGAREEGERVEALVSKIKGVRLEKRTGPEATKAELLSLFQSGRFDVIHYAGHAFFDPVIRYRSGILCAGGTDVLSGLDLASLASLPALVVCNACQSGQIRAAGKAAGARKKPAVRTEIARNASFAESFLRGGIANYVGTHWSVGDAPAKQFAETLYRRLAEGAVMREAVTEARQQVESTAHSKDWADYIHYGDPSFALKVGTGLSE